MNNPPMITCPVCRGLTLEMEESCVLCGKLGTIPERRSPGVDLLKVAEYCELKRVREELAISNRRANDYHRRAQKMAAALARAMDTGGGDRSFGRALANAGHCAQRTLRETADAEAARLTAELAKYTGPLTNDEVHEIRTGTRIEGVRIHDSAIRRIRERRKP